MRIIPDFTQCHSTFKKGAVPRKLINPHSKSYVKNSLAGLPTRNREAWEIFAEWLPSNPYIRGYILGRDKLKCQCCTEAIESASEAVVHHSTYNYQCSYYLADPSIRKASHIKTTCMDCHKKHPKYFKGCTKRLHCVHMACNKLINDRARDLHK